jgi:hypothetical protein
MNEIEVIKESVINLMNELEQSDGQGLDLFLECADLATLVKVEKKLTNWKEN